MHICRYMDMYVQSFIGFDAQGILGLEALKLRLLDGTLIRLSAPSREVARACCISLQGFMYIDTDT